MFTTVSTGGSDAAVSFKRPFSKTGAKLCMSFNPRQSPADLSLFCSGSATNIRFEIKFSFIITFRIMNYKGSKV